MTYIVYISFFFNVADCWVNFYYHHQIIYHAHVKKYSWLWKNLEWSIKLLMHVLMIILYIIWKVCIRNKCPQCEISRYRTDQVTKKVHRKVLRYIPIIPGFPWLFRCQSIAQFMDYHAKNISEYGVLRMLVDGSTLKNIKEKWPIFKDEPCNVKLSLAANGFNPFGQLRSTYSVWLFFVINNNLPPWMSIKREHTMLEMIILGIF